MAGIRLLGLLALAWGGERVLGTLLAGVPWLGTGPSLIPAAGFVGDLITMVAGIGLLIGRPWAWWAGWCAVGAWALGGLWMLGVGGTYELLNGGWQAVVRVGLEAVAILAVAAAVAIFLRRGDVRARLGKRPTAPDA